MTKCSKGICLRCKQEKYLWEREPFCVCDDCVAELYAKHATTHYRQLDSLSLEERIRKLEIQNYRPPQARDLMKGIPHD